MSVRDLMPMNSTGVIYIKFKCMMMIMMICINAIREEYNIKGG
jgi:hypothetical protein